MKSVSERGRWKGPSKTIRALVFARDGGRCRYCEKQVQLQGSTVDHIYARINGGCDAPANLILSCGRCNRFKGAFTLEELERLLRNTIAIQQAFPERRHITPTKRGAR